MYKFDGHYYVDRFDPNIPDLGSLVCTDANGSQRNYCGLALVIRTNFQRTMI